MRVKQKHLLSATFASGQKRVVGFEEKQEAWRSSVRGGKRQPGADGEEDLVLLTRVRDRTSRDKASNGARAAGGQVTWDGASGAEGRAPPERSPAAPTAPPRPAGLAGARRAGRVLRTCRLRDGAATEQGPRRGAVTRAVTRGAVRRALCSATSAVVVWKCVVSLCLSGGHRDGRRRRAPCRAAAHNIGPCSPAAATRLARARSRRGSGGRGGAGRTRTPREAE